MHGAGAEGHYLRPVSPSLLVCASQLMQTRNVETVNEHSELRWDHRSFEAQPPNGSAQQEVGSTAPWVSGDEAHVGSSRAFDMYLILAGVLRTGRGFGGLVEGYGWRHLLRQQG